MARDGDRGATTDDDDGDDALTTIIISPFKLYFMPLWTAAEASEASAASAAAFHNNRPPFPSSSPIHCWPDKTVIPPGPERETDEMK